MSVGVFLSTVDPDTAYRNLINEVLDNGMFYDDRFIIPTTTVRCYAGKRYLTTTGVSLPDIYMALFELINGPSELGTKVADLFNAGRDDLLYEGKSVITWFGFADVHNGILNFTVTQRDMDIVNNFGGCYTYYTMLMEMVSLVTGFKMGTITFFFNNAHVLKKDQHVQEYLKNQPSYFYKINPLNAPTYDYLKSCCAYALQILEVYRIDPNNPVDLSFVTDIGWRDLLVVCIFNVKISIGDYDTARGCIELLDQSSYERLWSTKQLEGVLSNAK